LTHFLFSQHAKELLLCSLKLIASSSKCADNQGFEPCLFQASCLIPCSIIFSERIVILSFEALFYPSITS